MLLVTSNLMNPPDRGGEPGGDRGPVTETCTRCGIDWAAGSVGNVARL